MCLEARQAPRTSRPTPPDTWPNGPGPVRGRGQGHLRLLGPPPRARAPGPRGANGARARHDEAPRLSADDRSGLEELSLPTASSGLVRAKPRQAVAQLHPEPRLRPWLPMPACRDLRRPRRRPFLAMPRLRIDVCGPLGAAPRMATSSPDDLRPRASRGSRSEDCHRRSDNPLVQNDVRNRRGGTRSARDAQDKSTRQIAVVCWTKMNIRRGRDLFSPPLPLFSPNREQNAAVQRTIVPPNDGVMTGLPRVTSAVEHPSIARDGTGNGGPASWDGNPAKRTGVCDESGSADSASMQVPETCPPSLVHRMPRPA